MRQNFTTDTLFQNLSFETAAERPVSAFVAQFVVTFALYVMSVLLFLFLFHSLWSTDSDSCRCQKQVFCVYLLIKLEKELVFAGRINNINFVEIFLHFISLKIQYTVHLENFGNNENGE